MHAETEEASARLSSTITAAGATGAQPAATNEVVARPTVALPGATQEVVAPLPSAAQEVAPVPPTSQAATITQPVSSMLQSFAFDDTRDGYSNDPNSLFN